jgi:AcrR family transcriptional regulator
MAAAREVFVEFGYHAAAMDDIADRASVSKPVLYQHFPSKLDLYLALLEEGIETLINSVHHARESTHDNKKRVHATMTAYFAFVAEPAGASRLVFESDLTREPAVAERVLQVDQACSQMVSAVIVEDTGLSSSQAELLASGLLGLAEAAARRWLRDCVESPDPSISLEEAADLVGSLAWRGIRSFPLSHPPSA